MTATTTVRIPDGMCQACGRGFIVAGADHEDEFFCGDCGARP